MDCWLVVDDTVYSSSRTSVEDEESRTAQRHYGQRGTGQVVRVPHKIAQYGLSDARHDLQAGPQCPLISC